MPLRFLVSPALTYLERVFDREREVIEARSEVYFFAIKIAKFVNRSAYANEKRIPGERKVYFFNSPLDFRLATTTGQSTIRVDLVSLSLPPFPSSLSRTMRNERFDMREK